MNLDNAFVHKWRNYFAIYLQPVLIFMGIFLILILIVDHFLHGSRILYYPGKITYLIVAFFAGSFISLGFFFKSAKGVKYLSNLGGISEIRIKEFRSQKPYQLWQTLNFLTILTIIFFIYLNEKYSMSTLDIARSYRDTVSYVQAAEYPLTDIRFWTARRPFTLPLIYKLSGYNLTNYSDQSEMNRMGYLQRSLSILGWTSLALSITLVMKRRLMKAIGFGCILAFGASLEITAWDKAMLSESISTTLLASLLALIIFAGWFWDRHRPVPYWQQALMLISLIMNASLFAFARDSNAYLLLFLALLMLIGIFFPQIRKQALFISYLSTILGFLVIFLLLNFTTIVGKRDLNSAFNVVVFRMTPQQDSLDFMVAHGMPYNASIASLSSLTVLQLGDKKNTDVAIQGWVKWVGDHGKWVVAQYLASHPVYTLTAPLKDFLNLINNDYRDYRKIQMPTRFRNRLLSSIMYPHSTCSTVFFAFLFLLTFFVGWKDRQQNALWYLVLVLFLAIIPLALLIWHSDPIDLGRHFFQVAVQFRLASWLSIILLLGHSFNFVEDRIKKQKLTHSVQLMTFEE